MRITQTIKSIVSGISQQPDILRFPEQLEEQTNGFSTESSGLQKRPPTLFIKDLGVHTTTTQAKNYACHTVDRDEEEKYIMLFTGEDILVYDLKGKQYEVTYEDEKSKQYITTENPREELKMVTIADHTFVVNTEVVVKMSEDKVPWKWSDHEALIHIQKGNYGREYSIKINGKKVAKYTTPDGGSASDIKYTDTNYIRDILGSAIQTEEVLYTDGKYHNQSSGWQVTYYNSAFKIYHPDYYINSFEVSDGFNGEAMHAIKHAVQKFNHLPADAPDGYTVKVIGDKHTGTDDYYVTFDGKEHVWKECAKPNISKGFDAETMPHILVRQSDGTFKLKKANWDERKAGDEESNEPPSFVDNTINDIFLFRNRLGFLSGENIILSRSASFFNFWLASAVELQDTDTIDLAVSNNSVSILEHAVLFNEELLLFSNNAQFIMTSEGILTPQKASVYFATSFPSATEVVPIKAGRRVYFPVKRALYSGIREYYTLEDTRGSKDAQDITAHVPSLIPNGVHKLWECTNESIILVASDATPDSLYVYKYLFSAGTRLQASWSKWHFKGAEIIGGGFFGSTFYMLSRRGKDKHIVLEKMIFTYNTKDYQDEPYRVFLDTKGITEPVPEENYDDINNQTKLSIKKTYGDFITPDSLYGIVTEDGHFFTFTTKEIMEDTCKVTGNYVGQKLVVGQVFNFSITLSTIMIKKQEENGMQVDNSGRLQLTRLSVDYSNSGEFYTKVTHKDKRQARVYKHTARILGHEADKLGKIPMDTGSMTFPIMSLNSNCEISIYSNAPTALSLLGYTWTGNYIKKTRSI